MGGNFLSMLLFRIGFRAKQLQRQQQQWRQQQQQQQQRQRERQRERRQQRRVQCRRDVNDEIDDDSNSILISSLFFKNILICFFTTALRSQLNRIVCFYKWQPAS